MSKVFKDLGSKFLKIFVNDLNVHNEIWEEHLQHLDAVFSKFKEVNLKLNPNKCCFATKNITEIMSEAIHDWELHYLS
jgi:hypothetical protein